MAILTLDGLFEAVDEVRALDAPAVERLEQLIRRSVLVLADRLAEELVPVAAGDRVHAALGRVPGRRVDVRLLAEGVAGRHGGHLGKPGSGNVSQAITGRRGDRRPPLTST